MERRGRGTSATMESAVLGAGQGVCMWSLQLLVWIRICLTSHLAYLSTVPMATESLGYLEDLASVRLAAHERVCKLHGKLETLLAQVRRDVTKVTTV